MWSCRWQLHQLGRFPLIVLFQDGPSVEVPLIYEPHILSRLSLRLLLRLVHTPEGLFDD